MRLILGQLIDYKYVYYFLKQQTFLQISFIFLKSFKNMVFL